MLIVRKASMGSRCDAKARGIGVYGRDVATVIHYRAEANLDQDARLIFGHALIGNRYDECNMGRTGFTALRRILEGHRRRITSREWSVPPDLRSCVLVDRGRRIRKKAEESLGANLSRSMEGASRDI